VFEREGFPKKKKGEGPPCKERQNPKVDLGVVSLSVEKTSWKEKRGQVRGGKWVVPSKRDYLGRMTARHGAGIRASLKT